MLKTKEIYLRALEPEDYKTTINWRRNPDIWQTLLGREYIVSEEYEKQWVEKAIFDSHAIRCAVCLQGSDRMIGLTTLYDINNIDRTVNYSLIIGENGERGKGYGIQATMLMFNYAFFKLNLNRISARVLCCNIASKKMLERNGAICEGTMREAVFKNGAYHDVYIMAVLRSDFEKLHRREA